MDDKTTSTGGSDTDVLPPLRKATAEVKESRFWTLSAEIRNMIYGYAYAHEGPFKVILKKDFDDSERQRRKREKHHFIAGTFPEYAVSSLMVSRQFFLELVPVFFARRDFYLPDFMDTSRFIDSLKRLHLSVSAAFFRDCEKCPWEDDFDPVDYEGVTGLDILRSLRGLREFSLETEPVHESHPERKAKWLKCIKGLEDLVKAEVTKPALQSSDVRFYRPILPAREQTSDNHLTPSGRHMNAMGASRTTIPTTISGAEIPETEQDLKRLIQQSPQVLLAWMKSVKEHNCV